MNHTQAVKHAYNKSKEFFYGDIPAFELALKFAEKGKYNTANDLLMVAKSECVEALKFCEMDTSLADVELYEVIKEEE